MNKTSLFYLILFAIISMPICASSDSSTHYDNPYAKEPSAPPADQFDDNGAYEPSAPPADQFPEEYQGYPKLQEEAPSMSASSNADKLSFLTAQEMEEFASLDETEQRNLSACSI